MRSSLALAAALVALLTLAASPASAATLHVGMPGRYFLPAQLEAVMGDTVVWHNSSSEAHDVAGARVDPGGEIARDFPDPGPVPYVCELHPSMNGAVEVVPVALAGPLQTPTAGQPLVLSGRAPAGTGRVTLERDGLVEATLIPAADGSFVYQRDADTAATWQAVTDVGASPPVHVDVADAVEVGLTARLGRRLTTLTVTTTPPRPGAKVALRLWSRERFAWRRAKTATLDSRGRTLLRLDARIRRRARVSLLGPDGSDAAVSRQVFTWRLKRAPRPPAPPHHHG